VRNDYKGVLKQTVDPSERFRQMDFTEPSLCQNPTAFVFLADDFLQSLSLRLQFHL
jgi:hypothetical protein